MSLYSFWTLASVDQKKKAEWLLNIECEKTFKQPILP